METSFCSFMAMMEQGLFRKIVNLANLLVCGAFWPWSRSEFQASESPGPMMMQLLVLQETTQSESDPLLFKVRLKPSSRTTGRCQGSLSVSPRTSDESSSTAEVAMGVRVVGQIRTRADIAQCALETQFAHCGPVPRQLDLRRSRIAEVGNIGNGHGRGCFKCVHGVSIVNGHNGTGLEHYFTREGWSGVAPSWFRHLRRHIVSAINP